ncbi:MAG TPA: YbhB/YbcL family Raf kinase inhibitor-like protein [Candidatus Acidoferrum sp.]|nr:YbhB/YbcL family Raf kinase inhibitor-like protein [Candidatus Acidoferrum sp.]
MSLLLALLVTTTTFAAGATVPNSMVAIPCGGENHSPQLHIEGVPAATRSLALILHDPDAPHAGGFYHWVLYDLPPNTRTLARDVQLDATQTGRNGTGSLGYFGPCPPPGKLHHYHFTVYALDIATLHAVQPLSAEELLERMRGHILAQAEVVGVLER